MSVPPRTATLVLLDGARVVGQLPPFPVATPWWQDMAPVVEGARRHHGVDVVVLRLLETAHPMAPGGAVTYLAELASPPPPSLTPWTGRLDDHPLRATWARPGGPAADLAWAAARLRERGLTPAGAPVQVRTWNLSSLWCLPLGDGAAWLKVVPPFFAHEGALLERLAGGPAPVPRPLAHDGPRMLLAAVAGDDLYRATLPQLLRMVDLLVAVQVAWAPRTAELLAIGAPDWRGASLRERIADVVRRAGGALSPARRAALDALLGDWSARMAAIAACGLPDTLVHGDFHPGNTRGAGLDLTLLDWGDSGVGQPLLDVPAFQSTLATGIVATVREHWMDAWARAVPGADPRRASTLLAPVAAARQAVVYQGFLDRIEPSEHGYHRHDPPTWLGRAADVFFTSERAG